jgi:hypothetical protein
MPKLQNAVSKDSKGHDRAGGTADFLKKPSTPGQLALFDVLQARCQIAQSAFQRSQVRWSGASEIAEAKPEDNTRREKTIPHGGSEGRFSCSAAGQCQQGCEEC